MAPVIDDEWVDADEWEDAPPESVRDAARKRLKARGINPKVPVDEQLPKRQGAFRSFQDALSEESSKGPNPFEYALAAARGVGLPRDMKEYAKTTLPNLVVPGLGSAISLASEARDIPQRVQAASTEFKDAPARQAAMTVAGALPLVGRPLQNLMRPSFVASDRPVTDDERMGAIEGATTLGGFAAGKAKGVVPGGGEWSGVDPTKGVRTRLSEKTAPQIGTNLLKPKNSQMQFGADPGEFVVGMKTKRGEGVSSYGPQIDAKLKTLNAQADQVAFNTPEGRSVPIDYEGALRRSFEKHIGEAVRDGNEGMAARLGSVLNQEIAALRRITGGEGAAPARVGRRYQQDLGNQVGRFQKSGKAGAVDPADGTIRSARQDAWVEIKNATNEAVPGLRDLNEQIHSGIEARKALAEREIAESKSDPLPWFRHPIAATVGAIPNAVNTPWFRSRLASGMRGLSPVEQPSGPPILDVGPMAPLTGSDPVLHEGGVPGSIGGENTPWRAGVRRPANEQRGLPPAPMNAPEGFISSDELRRVGTRVGQLPEQDAAVFAPQNQTAGMEPSRVPSPAVTPPPQSTIARDTAPRPDWATSLLQRNKAAQAAMTELSKHVRPEHAHLLIGELLQMPNYYQIFQRYMGGPAQ